MAQEANDQDIQKERESLKELILQFQGWFKFIGAKKWIVLIALIIGSIIGLIVALTTETTYSAKVTFVLEENKETASGISGLAAMAGINLGSSNGGLFQGDNIIDLFQSRRMLAQTLLTPVDTVNSKDLLVDSYIEMMKVEDEKKSKRMAQIDFHAPPNEFTRQQDSVLGKIIKNIRKDMLVISKPEKGRGQIEVEANSYDELFSKVFTETLVQRVTDFYIETRTQKSRENVDVLQFQVDSVRRELNEAIKDVALSNDFNLNPARQNLRVGSAQRQVDVQANEAILKELVKNLEIAKVSHRKESPLIQIIDYPVYPLDKSNLTAKKGMILGGIIAAILAVIGLVCVRYYHDIMQDE